MKIKGKIKESLLYTALVLSVLLTMPLAASAGQEMKMLAVGDSWEKDGWNLTVAAIDISAQPMFALISLSYEGKKIGDAKIEIGKSYIYKGRNPDGSEVPLFTIKNSDIFSGRQVEVVRLVLNWSIPADDVQIIDAPVESEQIKTEKTDTPAPTPTAQASQAPGFEIIFGIVGVLAVWWRLSVMRK